MYSKQPFNSRLVSIVLVGIFSFISLSQVQAQDQVLEANKKITETETSIKDVNNENRQENVPEEQTKSNQTTQSQKDLLGKVQTFYASAKDFSAEFKQTYTYSIYGRKKISTGKVYFKKPSKMRWDYETPTQRVFVADGKTLWVYEPEEAQVFKRDLSSAQLPIALRFMEGNARLDQEFIVQKISQEEQGPIVILLLKPKVPSPDFTSLELRVNEVNGEVKSSILVDPTENRNRIDFVEVKVNQDLPETGFSFTPPNGVRVIDEETRP